MSDFSLTLVLQINGSWVSGSYLTYAKVYVFFLYFPQKITLNVPQKV